MCGRYVFAKRRKELLSRYGLDKEFDHHGRRMPELPLFNVNPSMFMPVVILENGEREWVSMHWGFIPFWSKDGKMVPHTNNARSEGVATSRMFKEALASRRCLVPATGFYEWQGPPKNRIPNHIHLTDADIFSFAGIWTEWVSKDRTITIPSFSIITIDSNEFMARIHERMPVILPRDAEDRWLDPATPLDEATAMLQQYPSNKMAAYRVSKKVNRAGVEGEDLIEPVTGAELGEQVELF